jgi:hypothetical protein
VGRVEVRGSTVRAVLESLEAEYPGFGALVWSRGELSKFVKIFHDGQQVDGESLDGELAPDAELEVVAAIAGG